MKAFERLGTGKSISVGLSPFAPRKPRSFAERKATLSSAAVFGRRKETRGAKIMPTQAWAWHPRPASSPFRPRSLRFLLWHRLQVRKTAAAATLPAMRDDRHANAKQIEDVGQTCHTGEVDRLAAARAAAGKRAGDEGRRPLPQGKQPLHLPGREPPQLPAPTKHPADRRPGNLKLPGDRHLPITLPTQKRGSFRPTCKEARKEGEH